MNYSLSCLKQYYDRSNNYVQFIKAGKWASQLNDSIAEHWLDVFRHEQRQNFPDFNDILVMRRSGATYPIDRGGLHTTEGLHETSPPAKLWAEAAYFMAAPTLPRSFLEKMPEPLLGSPLTFSFDGLMLSGNGIMTSLTVNRIVEFCRKRGLADRPTRILEIGAGYGHPAYQLIKSLNVESYTICDLLENLFLNSFYLQAHFPERKAIFLGQDDAKQRGACLRFVVPPLIDELANDRFDLILNSYSFHEMDLATVKDYFVSVKNHLADGGIFYSLNAHSKDGTKDLRRPADYPVDQFEILSFGPARKFQFQIFGTNSYEMVLTQRASPSDKMESLFINQGVDALGLVMQLGLHDEILEICQKFSDNALNKTEERWLRDLYEYFNTASHEDKKQSVSRLRQHAILGAIVDYLEATLEFASNNSSSGVLTCIEKAAGGLADTQAKFRCYLMMASLASKAGDLDVAEKHRTRAVALIPHLADEFNSCYKSHSSLSRQVAVQIRLPVEKAAEASCAQIPGLKMVRKLISALRKR